MPSFDIVSKLDLSEVDNALAGINREIATRFDFKGSKCSLTREESALTVLADDELKLKQMHELLKVYLTRRKVDAAALEFKPPEKAAGSAQRQTVVLKQGIDKELAKRLLRELKDSKLKVRAASRATSCAFPARSATTFRRRSPSSAASRSSSPCNM